MLRIMGNKEHDKITGHAEKDGRDQGAAWAIAYIIRDGETQLAERMMREWGFKSLGDLHAVDAYDVEALLPLLKKEA